MYIARKKALALKLFSAAAAVAILAGCGAMSKTSPSLRMETAKRVAGPAQLMEAHIPAGEFTLMAFERVHSIGRPATVYIEGDGNLGMGDLSIFGDPTPVNPYALRMAADDNGSNVVYLARPCQFTEAMNTRACTKALYTTHRYSPQALDAMNAALENLKMRYDIPSFTLVGIGGGAAIAVELAAVRKDINEFRTVGGILDTRIANAGLKEDLFPGSLNPIDAAPRVAHIPQRHSVSANDKAKSLAMIESFLAAEGNPGTATMGPAVTFNPSALERLPETSGTTDGPQPLSR